MRMYKKYFRVSKPALFVTDIQHQVLVGALLGDGHITRFSERRINSAFCYASKSKQHVGFIHSYLLNLASNKEKEVVSEMDVFDKRTGKYYKRFYFTTKYNTAFTSYRKEWYYATKIIPTNVVLTPLVCLVWYIGDGCIMNRNKNNTTDGIQLATNGFSKNDIESVLLPQLAVFEPFISINKNKQCTIKIPRRKIELFLNYIGCCPFEEYKHKWFFHSYKRASTKIKGVNNHTHKKDKIYELYRSGKTRYEISRLLEIEESLVGYYLRKIGIDLKGERSSCKMQYFKSPNHELFATRSVGELNKQFGFPVSHGLHTLKRIKKYKGWLSLTKEEYEKEHIGKA